jgi:hypothetical protein
MAGIRPPDNDRPPLGPGIDDAEHRTPFVPSSQYVLFEKKVLACFRPLAAKFGNGSALIRNGPDRRSPLGTGLHPLLSLKTGAARFNLPKNIGGRETPF